MNDRQCSSDRERFVGRITRSEERTNLEMLEARHLLLFSLAFAPARAGGRRRGSRARGASRSLESGLGARFSLLCETRVRLTEKRRRQLREEKMKRTLSLVLLPLTSLLLALGDHVEDARVVVFLSLSLRLRFQTYQQRMRAERPENVSHHCGTRLV